MTRDFSQELIHLFYEHFILDMATIQKLIPNRSRCSLFRDLQKVEYLSSYNKAGRFYTLKSIPKFDETGLWRYQGVFFAKQGSLKNTAKYLVNNSVAGHTHLELQQILDVRVHNTLLDLVSMKEIARAMFQGVYVYIHLDPAIRSAQLEEREKLSKLIRIKPTLDPYMTIEILCAVIKRQEHSTADIHHYLLSKEINISLQQVEEVFSFYDLGKKNFQ